MGPAWQRAVNCLVLVEVEAIVMTHDFTRVRHVLLEEIEQTLVAKSRPSKDAFDLPDLCVRDISIVALNAGFTSPEARVMRAKRSTHLCQPRFPIWQRYSDSLH